MIKPNNENSKCQLSATQKTLSNTHLFLHLLLSLSTNSLDSLLSALNQAKINVHSLNIHLDYLRISITTTTKKSFDRLLANLGLPIPSLENKKLWHPHPKMSKSKKYQNSIRSNKGIILGYTKRLLNKSKKPKYVYDIMIDFSGSYFSNLSLLEQIKLIQYLNSNWKVKCHRIDVAMDDYSQKLFPIFKIRVAVDEGNYFGFTETDAEYLYCTNEGCIGTLALGSRKSEYYARVYTSHQYFNRWETELKQKKAQKLFTEIAALTKDKVDNKLSVSDIQKTLVKAAIGKIDFRDKSTCKTSTNATRARTYQLPFWENTLSTIYLSIEKQANSN